MGFSRQEYWSELPFPSPGDLPDPGIEPRSPTLQADSLPSEPQGSSDRTWVNERENSQGVVLECTTSLLEVFCLFLLIDFTKPFLQKTNKQGNWNYTPPTHTHRMSYSIDFIPDLSPMLIDGYFFLMSLHISSLCPNFSLIKDTSHSRLGPIQWPHFSLPLYRVTL